MSDTGLMSDEEYDRRLLESDPWQRQGDAVRGGFARSRTPEEANAQGQAARTAPAITGWEATELASMTPVPGVSDVASGALAARDFREGNYLGAALNGIGVLPLVPSLGGMIVGRASRNPAHHAAMDRAEEILRKGPDSPEAHVDAYHKTNSFRGPDGLMRYEIYDGNNPLSETELARSFDKVDVSRLSDPTYRPPIHETTYGELLPHPELYSAHPGLASTPIQIVPGRERLWDGIYGQASLPIGGRPDDYGEAFLALPQDNLPHFRNTFLHEGQHLVQGKEGFQYGGNPASPDVSARIQDPTIQSGYDLLRQQLNNVIDRTYSYAQEILKYEKGREPTFDEVRNFLPSFMARPENSQIAYDFRRTLAASNQLDAGTLQPFDQYVRILGEAEARATGFRDTLSETAARNIYPSRSYDVDVRSLWDPRTGQPSPWLSVPRGTETYPTVDIKHLGFAEGGMPMNDDDHPLTGLMAEQEDGELEDLPPGSLPEEVRDDIDVKLSEGEFVFPADVVRWVGLKQLMDMRSEAKQGLAQMASEGMIKAPSGAIPSIEAADGGLMGPPHEAAEELEQYGRFGDSLLAHITPEEAALLKARGGAGTRNPVTGLMEFWSENSSSEAGSGHSNSGAAEANGPGSDGGYSVDGMMNTDQPAEPITQEVEVGPPPGFEIDPNISQDPDFDAFLDDPGLGPVATTGQRAGIAGLQAAAQGLFGIPGFGPVANAAVRGVDTQRGVMSTVAMSNPVTALGYAVTEALHAMGVPQTGFAETAQQSTASPNANAGGNSPMPTGMMAPGTVGSAPSNPYINSPWAYAYPTILGLMTSAAGQRPV